MQFFDPYRKQNIFGPAPTGGNIFTDQFDQFGGQTSNAPLFQPQPLTPTSPQQDFDYESEINRIMSKFPMQHGAEDAYQAGINEMPERNQPGIWRKLGAGLIGVGHGLEAGDRALYYPYYNQLADWKERMGPLQKAAEFERYSNANERQLAYQTAQATVQGRKTDIQQQRANTYADAESRKADAERFRQAADRFKLEHPDWKPENDVASGNIWFVNPKDPSQRYDTGLKHGEASDLDQARWRKGTAESVANIRAEAKKDEDEWQLAPVIEQGIQVGSQWVKKPKGDPRNIVPVSTPGGAPLVTKPTAPAAIKQWYQNKIGELQRGPHPEWEQYINVDPQTGQVKIKETKPWNFGRLGSFSTGPSPAIRKELEKFFQLPSTTGGTGFSREDWGFDPNKPPTEAPPTSNIPPGAKERKTSTGKIVYEYEVP